MESVGVRVGQMMESEAARGPEDGETKKKSMSLEDLRRKYLWWPSGHVKEGSPNPLIDMEAGAGENATLKTGKSTSDDDTARGVFRTLEAGIAMSS
jgi:hypothetical protein